jgi:hypothetical protein
MRSLAIVYRLAVAFWTGGAVLFTLILTPAIFGNFDRDLAGTIVGVMLPGYFRWGLACGAVALVCLLLANRPQNLALAVILVAMLAVASVQALVIEPRAAALKEKIPSFVTTPVDHPLRQQFKTLHAISAAGNLGVIGGGIVLILLFKRME